MTRKAWDKMSKKERRVSIARDVLRRLERGELRLGINYYCEPDDDEDFALQKGDISKEDITKLQTECRVCARGAFMISRISKCKDVKWEQLKNGKSNTIHVDNEANSNILKDSFTQKQLGLIEAAFEFSLEYGVDYGNSSEDSREAAKFGYDLDKPQDRLIAICQNIIDNDGKFNPYIRYEVK